MAINQCYYFETVLDFPAFYQKLFLSFFHEDIPVFHICLNFVCAVSLTLEKDYFYALVDSL